MKKPMSPFFMIAVLSVCLLFSGQIFAEELELQVIVQKANIRAKPDLSSEIVAQVSVGTVLKSDMKEGRWYRVILPPDEKGQRRLAFIHDSIVEVIGGIDLMTGISGLSFPSAYKRRVKARYMGVDVCLISIKDLITNKTAGGRDIDLRDVEMLRKYGRMRKKKED